VSRHLIQAVSNIRRGGKAQAMVEFALALPIFLLVVYGLLETGRLIFLYSTVITSSREGVRYASAAGWNDTTNQTPHYQDCAGIRAAAKNAGFLLNLQDNQILIYYDRPAAPGVTAVPLTPYCTVPPDNAKDASPPLDSGQGYRVLVNVSTPYSLAVPLVPFTQRTISSGLTARTYMGIINLIPPPAP
jgi:Flp pilus assembly protein TadG